MKYFHGIFTILNNILFYYRIKENDTFLSYYDKWWFFFSTLLLIFFFVQFKRYLPDNHINWYIDLRKQKQHDCYQDCISPPTLDRYDRWMCAYTFVRQHPIFSPFYHWTMTQNVFHPLKTKRWEPMMHVRIMCQQCRNVRYKINWRRRRKEN